MPRGARSRSLLLVGLALGALASPLAIPAAYAAPDDPTSGLKAPQQTRQKGKVKAASSRGDRLGSHDRELLAEARRTGAKRVTVMMATDKKAASTVAEQVRADGGWTGMVNDKVGYVRASVPTGAVEKVSKLRKVLAVDLDESVQLDDPSPAAKAGAKAAAVAAPECRKPPTPTRTCRPRTPAR